MSAFAGNERFHVLRRLGHGASGVVYEVVDRQREARVALKTLARLDAAALYRFKREFRALADVAHPNLVQLYELFAEQRGWFFTMELVPGSDFLGWVRGEPKRALVVDTLDEVNAPTLTETPTDEPPVAVVANVKSTSLPAADLGRLRAAMGELAQGVHALHEAGMLHRDLKPTNVLVSDAGRVVIVDFGISTEINLHKDSGLLESHQEGLIGTPAYMSPEQGNGEPSGPPTDWYGVGVMLYEALTGRLPFLGAPLQILGDKMRFEPPPPRELRKGVPEDLDRLCVDLLRRKPESRPKGEDVLRRLGITPGSASLRSVQTYHTVSGSFVGREASLERLRLGFERSREGKCVRVLVKGPSGMGKTALVRRFLEHVAVLHRPIVLSARCYERESVPYKAFDGVVDELSRYLRQIPRAEADSLLPRDASVLARVFPVLARVPSIADAPRRGVGAGAASDAHQMRTRAFAALRDLLGRIADRRPLVIFIDDVQWGDTDSAALLAQLTTGTDAPSMMVIVSYRTEDEDGPIVHAFRQRGQGPEREDVEELVVEALTPEESRRLAGLLLGTDEDDGLGATIADEAAGNALFVGELVRYVQSSAGRQSSTGIRLERVLRERILDLSDAPRRLLEVLSVAGRPLVPEIARSAAALEADQGMQSITELRLQHFIRSSGPTERRTVEVLHDRVREVTLGLLDDEEQREIHARLADALRAAGDVDPELLFTHFRAAGRVERACEYAEAAADRAERALAFDRAAHFYRYVLAERGKDAVPSQHLRVSLGTALAHAGRGPESAQAFLAAASSANEAERLELLRRAAEQLLQSGHVDQGVEAIQTVLHALGMGLAATPARALWTLVFLRLWLSLRLAFGPSAMRDRSSVAATMLTRIDVCWSVGAGFAVVDTVRAAEFQTRNSLLSLSAREPMRLARALALETVLQATSGPKSHARASRILERVRGIGQQFTDPAISAYLGFGEAGLAYFTGRFQRAIEVLRVSVDPFRDAVVDGRWESNSLQYFNLCAMVFTGDFDEASRMLPPVLREAEERGDLYLHTNLRVGDTNLLWLVHDEPDAALKAVDESMSRWSRRSFHLQHFYEAQARANLDLYRGDGAAALDRIEKVLPDLHRSMQMRIYVTWLKVHQLRARAAIMASIAKKDPTLLAVAADSVRALAKERSAPSQATAAFLGAGIASARGERDRAVSLLRGAAEALAGADLRAQAHSARWALGTALGGDEGSTLREDARAELARRSVKVPEKLAALYAAGFEIG